MSEHEIEDIIIQSLDAPLTKEEKEILKKGLNEYPRLSKQESLHYKLRETMLRQTSATFGKSFAVKLTARIENSGVVIERFIFSFFKKYQLLVAGVIVGLLILNTVFSQQVTVDTILGLEDNSISADEIVSFDFNQFLNKSDE